MAKFIPSNNDGTINTDFSWQTDPNLTFDETSDDIKKLIQSNNIHNKYQSGLFDKFARFGVIDPFNAMTVTKEYVFITKPDLCLVQGNGIAQPILSNVPFFQDTIARFPEVANQLQYSVDAKKPFMNMLSNSLTNTLDLPGISADTIETSANAWGTKISYRGTSHKSDEEFDFTLEFEDTKNLGVYTLFKLYDEYEKYKWNGGLNFTNVEDGSYDRWKNYIKNKVLYDVMSLYKFVVAEDGMRIIYWAKLTGCYPTSIPREAFSDMSNSDGQKISVGWKCHFVRDMDPMTIIQFNKLSELSGASSREDLPLYDTSTHSMNGEWATVPYIEIADIQVPNGATHREYYLKWKR